MLLSKAKKNVLYIEEEAGKVYFLKKIGNPLLPLNAARLTVQGTVSLQCSIENIVHIVQDSLQYSFQQKSTKGRKESLPCRLSQIIQSL